MIVQSCGWDWRQSSAVETMKGGSARKKKLRGAQTRFGQRIRARRARIPDALAWGARRINSPLRKRAIHCYGLPGFGLSSVGWDYNPYTHHTNRDTFDKVIFDELRGNATITAMLMYLASEDPTFITRERADLSQPQANANAGGRGGRGGRASWPEACPKGRRSTDDTSRVTIPSRGN